LHLSAEARHLDVRIVESMLSIRAPVIRRVNENDNRGQPP
jgi:hypothetical protein